MMYRILLVAAVAVSFAAAQVTISPAFDKVINEYDPIAFSYRCQNGDTSSTVYPVWTNQAGTVIQTQGGGASARVYTTESVEGPYSVSRLTFENVEMSENGNYTCTVGGSYERRSVIVSIPISFPLQAAETSQRLLVTEPPQSGTISCTINSNPFPKVFWSFNSNSISGSNTNDRYEQSTSPVTGDLPDTFEHAQRAVLTVQDVVSTDTGSYKCFASVDETGQSLTMTIEVIAQVPPEWTVEPQDTSAVEGQDTTIQCAASGTPDPTYTWKNPSNQAIVATSGKYELTDDGEFLKIIGLTTDDDGSYECTASNDAVNSTFSTQIVASFSLDVLIPPTLNNQNNQTVEEGDTFSMDCIVTRSDDSTVLSWRRGGVMDDDVIPVGTWAMDSRVSVALSTDGNTLTLTLTPAHYDHSGGWTCYAESDAGNAQVTHYMSIESEPFINRAETPSRVLSWPGNPVNLTCVFNGFPAPTIKWYNVDDYVLNATDRITFWPGLDRGTSVVYMTPTKADFGPYYCEAKNDPGTARERIDLVEGAFPSEPINVKLSDFTASTMRVQYDQPEDDGGFDIYYYVVMYNMGQGTLNTSREYDNITNVIIDGLSGNSRYYVRVAAANDRGVGLYSTEVSGTTLDTSLPTTTTVVITTMEKAEPGMPDIESNEDSAFSDKYRLTWEAPLDNGGSPITYYVIRYSQAESPSDKKLGARFLEYEVDHTQRESTISGLNENMYYNIELSAKNDIGEGEPAVIQIKTTGGFVFPSTPATRPEQQIGVMGTTEIVIIVIACFIILLILIDVCCFCMNDCGLLMFICVNCCGKTAPSAKDEIEMADEEYGGTKTSPPVGDGPPTYQPIENGKPDEPTHEKPAGEAEADPLMKQDGLNMDDNANSDSPIVRNGELGQGEGVSPESVTIETETVSEAIEVGQSEQ